MGKYSIMLGATDGYRYISVEPPVDEGQISEIFEELGEDIEHEGISNGAALETVKPRSRPPYSELGLGTVMLEVYKTNTHKLAAKIASVLEESGHTVNIDPKVKQLDQVEYFALGQPE